MNINKLKNHEFSIYVRPVRSKKEYHMFIHFPWKIYRGKWNHHPAWTPPLLMQEKEIHNTTHNPFFLEGGIQENFLAYHNNEVVGRISAMINPRFIQHVQQNIGFFGLFECYDRTAISNALLSAAENYLHNAGMDIVWGPITQTTSAVIGCMITGEMPSKYMIPWNPLYYNNLITNAGYEKEKDIYSYRMTTNLVMSNKIQRVQAIARQRNKITLQPINIKRDWDNLSEEMRLIYNEAWAENWGMLPLTKKEFSLMSHSLKLIVDEELCLFALVDGKPAGFAIPIPDMNELFIHHNGRLTPQLIWDMIHLIRKRKHPLIHTFRVALLGIRKEYRNLGIDAVFIYELYTRGDTKQYDGAEFSWILEDNTDLINLLENWGTQRYKEHRIYCKNIKK